MSKKTKLAIWEIVCVFWVCIAGSALHFAFELSEYWTPMALIAAVNESAWEHTKMYFWPGLAYALAQYTYTRHIANNYWFGKAMALAITPVAIFGLYFGYLQYAFATGASPSLPIMLSIMIFGIALGQFASWYILTREPMAQVTQRYATAAYAALIVMFSTFTYLPPKVFLFENFACYTYTGEYGILEDYEPYRIFTRVTEEGEAEDGQGVNYCAGTELASAG